MGKLLIYSDQICSKFNVLKATTINRENTQPYLTLLINKTENLQEGFFQVIFNLV